MGKCIKQMVLWDFNFYLILVFFKKKYTFKHKTKPMNKKFNSFNRFIVEWETILIFPPYCFVNELAFNSIKKKWCFLKNKVVKYLFFLVFYWFSFGLLDQLLHSCGTLNMCYNLLGLQKVFSCPFFIHIHHLFHFSPFLLQM